MVKRLQRQHTWVKGSDKDKEVVENTVYMSLHPPLIL